MLLLLLTMSIQLSVLQSCLIGYPEKKEKKNFVKCGSFETSGKTAIAF
jgi:hypothetical protein